MKQVALTDFQEQSCEIYETILKAFDILEHAGYIHHESSTGKQSQHPGVDFHAYTSRFL